MTRGRRVAGSARCLVHRNHQSDRETEFADSAGGPGSFSAFTPCPSRPILACMTGASIRRFLIWSAVVFALSLSHLLSCSCSPAPPPLKAMAKTDAVFTGKVTKLKTGWIAFGNGGKIPMVTATVVVGKCIKGHIHGKTTVLTGVGGGDCGYHFFEGESYLFYAMKQQNGQLETSFCSRTQRLAGAKNEILELEKRLPALETPEREPVLQLKCKIDDAGYNGYIFILHNRLHARIFYLDYNCTGHLTQVEESGHWTAYPSNYWEGPRKEIEASAIPKLLADQKMAYDQIDPKENGSYLDRLGRGHVFVAKPTATKTWRIGFQYLTEAELDAGGKIQESKHFAWSEPINENTPAKSLPFREAFEQ